MINTVIKQELDDYLEFNSSELFAKPNIPNLDGPVIKKIQPLVRIFGGAIRDILAKKPIHDVDILVGSRSLKYISMVLEINGYKHLDLLATKDLNNLYTNIRVISEPYTWVKGTKVIQLIRPRLNINQSQQIHKLTEDSYIENFKHLISNVDISSCGVSYDGSNLYENYPNAVNHCLHGVFCVNQYAAMYSRDRIHVRTQKLMERGWESMQENTAVNRDLKLESILDEEIQVEFISEYYQPV